MMGDSDDIDQRDLLTIGAYLFNDGILKYGAYPKMDFDSIWTLGYDAAMEYEKIAAIMPKETSKGLENSGNYYSRSDWTPSAAFIHFHCGTLGAGHGHADKLHIDIFYNGEDILLDPGRYTYVPGDSRYWYKMPYAHNTTAVDGTDLYECVDSWQCNNLSRPVGQKFVQHEDGYVYMEGGHLGYMAQGVYVSRRVIHINPDIILLCDAFYAPKDRQRTYRQYFQFNNRGKVTSMGNTCTYKSEKNQARIVLLSENDIETRLLPGKISRHYNLEEEAIRLQTRMDATGFAGIFTAIALDNANSDELFTIKKEIVHSNFKGIIFDHEDIEVVTITKGTRQYTVAIAHNEYASPTDTFTAGGCVGFGNAVIFDKSCVPPKAAVLLH
jgi:hypothetical protein